ncbi:MAG: YbfB/YjiJ family MFS transporter [Thermodesulfovibrionales bacterium]|nr:YbfB/YjiJ family MFS transporter [Thermodesulfovibrionales bacterium]
MLLPSMSNALNLSYIQMGVFSTANFVGYLLTVLFAGRIISVLDFRLSIFVGLMTSGLTMLIISKMSDLYTLTALYSLTGIGSGITNISVMGLVTRWFDKTKRGVASGFVVIGSGFSILIAGILVPFINQHYGVDGWRISWAISSAIVLFVAFVSLLLVRNNPQVLGLLPFGESPTKTHNTPTHKEPQSEYMIKRITLHLGIIYFIFGFTYVIYVTFIVTALIKEFGFSEGIAGEFWSWVGISSLLSGPLFGFLSDKIGRKKGIMLVFFIQMFSYLIVSLNLGYQWLYVSIICFGITAWSIPSIMAATVGDFFGSLRSPSIFGYITFIFGIGQVLGPLIGGLIAEWTGGFSTTFLVSAMVVFVGIIITSTLRQPQT